MRRIPSHRVAAQRQDVRRRARRSWHPWAARRRRSHRRCARTARRQDGGRPSWCR